MRAFALAPLLATAALAGCDLASPDPGSAALLQLDDAQYVPGRPPPASDGPAVDGLTTSHARVAPGDTRERLRGTLGEDASAVVLWLEGDLGHWIVPAAPPETESPDRPSFDVRLAFAAALPPGPVAVEVRAVDDDGRVGEPLAADYLVELAPPPTGELVVSLAWRGAADLDLHVIDPDGVEIWSGNPNSYVPPAPGTPAPPDAWQQGGILDLDANARCSGGGLAQENVVWTAPPPSGTYAVRVDTRAMCGAAFADWSAAAYLAGEPVEAASGKGVPAMTRLEHGPGAGALAFELEVP
jgi:hypothetical protein